MKIISRHLRSTCSLGIIASFVVFLAASAPHRVHHLFENLPKPHGHDHHAHSSIQSGTTSAVDHDTKDHEHCASPAHAGTTHDDQNHNGTRANGLSPSKRRTAFTFLHCSVSRNRFPERRVWGATNPFVPSALAFRPFPLLPTRTSDHLVPFTFIKVISILESGLSTEASS